MLSLWFFRWALNAALQVNLTLMTDGTTSCLRHSGPDLLWKKTNMCKLEFSCETDVHVDLLRLRTEDGGKNNMHRPFSLPWRLYTATILLKGAKYWEA